jgi:hypothetical protein
MVMDSQIIRVTAHWVLAQRCHRAGQSVAHRVKQRRASLGGFTADTVCRLP